MCKWLIKQFKIFCIVNVNYFDFKYNIVAEEVFNPGISGQMKINSNYAAIGEKIC